MTENLYLEDIKKQNKRMEQLALSAWSDLFSKNKELVNLIPPGWLPLRNHITVSFDDRQVSLEFGSEGNKPIPFYMYRHPYSNAIEYAKTSKLYKMYTKLVSDKRKTNEKIKAVYVDINKLLYSVSTDKQLYKIWPEAENIIVSIIGPPKIKNLPALNNIFIKDLNNALGIKKGK